MGPFVTLSDDTIAAMDRLRTAPATSAQGQRSARQLESVGEVAQDLKAVMRHAPGWCALTPGQREALDQSATRAAELLAGFNNLQPEQLQP